MNHTSFVISIFDHFPSPLHGVKFWIIHIFCNLYLQSLLAMCMRLEDDQNKLSVFNHDGFIIENIFCFANHPATRAHFIISFIRNWYNQNALSFSIKHIMKKNIIWFMYVYLEKRQGLKAGTVVLLLLITLSTPAEPLLLTRQQKYLWNINDIMQFYWSVLVSALWKSIYWLPPRLLGRQILWPGRV